MKSHWVTGFAGRTFQTAFIVFLGAVLFLVCASPDLAQQKEKKKKKDAPIVNNDSGNPVFPMTDEQQIDYMLSEMLGAWQLGDVDKLHNDYADDVSVVNGVWGPPFLGWKNFLDIYQQQRSHMQQVRMDRYNTYIKVSGTIAWACYQWDFTATVDGQPSTSQGQTTLVLEKRNNRWVIVHNHTSLAAMPQGAAPPRTSTPGQPTPEAKKPPSR